MQNIVDTLLTSIPIASQYSYFDIPWQADQGNTLQFCVYLGLALSEVVTLQGSQSGSLPSSSGSAGLHASGSLTNRLLASVVGRGDGH